MVGLLCHQECNQQNFLLIRCSEKLYCYFLFFILRINILSSLFTFYLQLLDSYKFQCAEEMLTIAAMISVQVINVQKIILFISIITNFIITFCQNVFVTSSSTSAEFEDEKRKFAVEEGDHITSLNGQLNCKNLSFYLTFIFNI